MQTLPERKASGKRITKETQIELSLNLDGTGNVQVDTGLGMLDHLLTLTFYWARMDLTLHCTGDLNVDGHHTVEDTALVLGEAMREALGDRKGIGRVGFARVPMDEALAEVTIDISGRPWLEYRGDDILPPMIGHEEKDVWREWFKALSSAVRMNLHISFLYGKNGHHLLESAAKGLGLALHAAMKREGNAVLSTKGSLD